MEISALGFLLVLASIGLLAASKPGGRRELDADIHGMQDGYFMDSPGGWRMDNDEDPWTHWGDNGYLPGATNLVAYSDSKPSIEKVQPSFEHHLQVSCNQTMLCFITTSSHDCWETLDDRPATFQIDIMLFKIYDEVKMFELVELEPNSTESRCLDCCTPTPYDPKRPIMRREERASTRDQPLQNVSVTLWTEVVASSMEVNRTGLLRKSLHPSMDRCSHCCLLSVVQKVKRLDADDS